MTTLYVDINGRREPISECSWLMRRPCGCIVAASLAEQGGDVLATQEQFHKQIEPRKDRRERHLRDGMTFELITMKHYRENIGARWECADHTPKES